MQKTPVGAVVVAFRPTPQILLNIAILSGQVAHVVVVDNTPQADTDNVIRELERLSGCTVIRNSKNLGIAAALNIGIRHAISMGSKWIITFDQDSQIRDGFVEAMLRTYADAQKKSPVGMICPRYVDQVLGIQVPMDKNANGEIVGCWTSGSMIEATRFESVGPYEEQLFIDFVDHEYSMRMRLNGMRLIECHEAILLHSLGRITLHRILGRQFTITNHSPKRRYYINRNRLVLIRRYFRKDREWALTEVKGLAFDSAMVLLVEDQKLAKAGYMLRALYDGMFNRLGQRVPL